MTSVDTDFRNMAISISKTISDFPPLDIINQLTFLIKEFHDHLVTNNITTQFSNFSFNGSRDTYQAILYYESHRGKSFYIPKVPMHIQDQLRDHLERRYMLNNIEFKVLEYYKRYTLPKLEEEKKQRKSEFDEIKSRLDSLEKYVVATFDKLNLILQVKDNTLLESDSLDNIP
jgi:hypothetical protein